MHEACLKAENTIPYVSHFEELCTLVKRPVSIVESCAMASVRASLDLNAAAIFVLSTSGQSARLISKYRPVCPIIMITRNASASRYCHLYRGVYPFFFPEAKPDFEKVNWQEDVDRRIKWGLGKAMGLGILAEGETVVVVQGWKVSQPRDAAYNAKHLSLADTWLTRLRAAWATPTRCALLRRMWTISALVRHKRPRQRLRAGCKAPVTCKFDWKGAMLLR
jgi:pyruvate kinase